MQWNTWNTIPHGATVRRAVFRLIEARPMPDIVFRRRAARILDVTKRPIEQHHRYICSLSIPFIIRHRTLNISLGPSTLSKTSLRPSSVRSLVTMTDSIPPHSAKAKRRKPKRFAPLDPDSQHGHDLPRLKGIVFDVDGTLWYGQDYRLP